MIRVRRWVQSSLADGYRAFTWLVGLLLWTSPAAIDAHIRVALIRADTARIRYCTVVFVWRYRLLTLVSHRFPRMWRAGERVHMRLWLAWLWQWMDRETPDEGPWALLCGGPLRWPAVVIDAAIEVDHAVLAGRVASPADVARLLKFEGDPE